MSLKYNFERSENVFLESATMRAGTSTERTYGVGNDVEYVRSFEREDSERSESSYEDTPERDEEQNGEEMQQDDNERELSPPPQYEEVGQDHEQDQIPDRQVIANLQSELQEIRVAKFNMMEALYKSNTRNTTLETEISVLLGVIEQKDAVIRDLEGRMITASNLLHIDHIQHRFNHL